MKSGSNPEVPKSGGDYETAAATACEVGVTHFSSPRPSSDERVPALTEASVPSGRRKVNASSAAKVAPR